MPERLINVNATSATPNLFRAADGTTTLAPHRVPDDGQAHGRTGAVRLQRHGLPGRRGRWLVSGTTDPIPASTRTVTDGVVVADTTAGLSTVTAGGWSHVVNGMSVVGTGIPPQRP